jgi:predicted Fe-S protein YdhL (DUF1289 family)
MPNQTIKTPCVGLCSTVYGDLVCRGCKRFHHEVIHWNGYNEDEKRAVWLRLEQLLSQVMAAKVEILIRRCAECSWSSARSASCPISRNTAGRIS